MFFQLRNTRPRGKEAQTVTSLVFPTYNPGPAVEQTWQAVRDFLRTRADAWEILFVCDGCKDGTPERLRSLQSTYPDPRIRIVDYSPNRGKGYAVRVGLLAATGENRIFTDVDLAYGFDDVCRVMDELNHGAAVAIASREHPKSELTLPVKMLGYAYRRRLQSRVFGRLARLMLPIRQRDTQAGLKGFTAAAVDSIMPRVTCNGFGFDCEVLTACAKLQIPVTEIPIHVRTDDAASTTGAGTTVQMLRELWGIRRVWRNGAPAPIPLPELNDLPARKVA